MDAIKMRMLARAMRGGAVVAVGMLAVGAAWAAASLPEGPDAKPNGTDRQAAANRASSDPSGNVTAIARQKPELEMVFVLDTTGSMGGLIEGAKQKIWSIVNAVQKSDARPSVRVGLVAYRDHGDAYITKVVPLSDDLDKVYRTLMDFKADGGGDTPEDVRQALSDGVHKAGWSSDTQGTAQILFLVGDAPPHDDYTTEPDTLTSAAEAAKAGIVINTIECGSAEDTRVSWQSISTRGAGEFFAIEQSGGVAVVATPYDTTLAQLGAKMGTTYMAYGGGAGYPGMAFRSSHEKAQAGFDADIASAAPVSAQADRALNKAINGRAYAGDLFQSIENGTTTLEKVKHEDLPDELQKLKPEELKLEVERRLAERKHMRARILDLSKLRSAYIAAEEKKQAGATHKASFDSAVVAALKKQAARRGIKL